MKKALFFLGLIFLAACGVSEQGLDKQRVQEIATSLSPYERGVLSAFFRLLLTEECCGYSLYGEKPVCVQEFIEGETPLAVHQDLIIRSCFLREGYRIWQKSGLANIPSNYVIQASQSSNSEGWLDLFFINKRSFLNVVDKDLTLFQYVLGPKVTSRSLLGQFLDPKQNLSSILHEDRVLTGLVLGYGVQNSLHGSRLEYLHEHLRSNKLTSENGESMARIGSCAPSFGFSSISEEKEHFQQKIFITTDRANRSPRLPWFSAIEHEETDRLLATYETTQKKIEKILASDRFLEEVLIQFFGYPLTFPTSENSLRTQLIDQLEKEDVPLVIAQELLVSLRKESASTEEIESFMRGFQELASEKEPLAPLLRKYNENAPIQERRRLLYRLGQKIGDQYKNLGSIAPIEKITYYMQQSEFSETAFLKRREIIDQANILNFLSGSANNSFLKEFFVLQY